MKIFSKRSASSILGVVAATILVAGCQPKEEEKTTPSDAPTHEGVYLLDFEQPDAASAEIAVIAFVGDAEDPRYWLWKNSAECPLVVTTSVDVGACAESGTYAIANDELTLTPSGGGAVRKLPIHATASEKRPLVSEEPTSTSSFSSSVHFLEGGGLVGGTGTPLVEPKNDIVTQTTVGGGNRVYRWLVQRGQRLITCEAGPGSGEIPANGNPGDKFRDGRFDPGTEFGPGGARDVATIPPGNQILEQRSDANSHRYSLISGSLPCGTSYDRADDALQRFNGPTGPAMSGGGDDPSSTKGWVVEPTTNAPIGCVTFERGNGWARNTTQSNHPLIGTITRYVVNGGTCPDGTPSYRILTVGEGHGGDILNRENGSTAVENRIRQGRHLANIHGGPIIFEMLDRRLITYVQNQPRP